MMLYDHFVFLSFVFPKLCSGMMGAMQLMYWNAFNLKSDRSIIVAGSTNTGIEILSRLSSPTSIICLFLAVSCDSPLIIEGFFHGSFLFITGGCCLLIFHMHQFLLLSLVDSSQQDGRD